MKDTNLILYYQGIIFVRNKIVYNFSYIICITSWIDSVIKDQNRKFNFATIVGNYNVNFASVNEPVARREKKIFCFLKFDFTLKTSFD